MSDSGRNTALDYYGRQRVQTGHTELAQAATQDSRWAPLQNLVREHENTAITRWDRGRVITADAVNQTMGSRDIDTIRGYCAAAKSTLTTDAQRREVSPAALPRAAGATAAQVRVRRIWAAD